MTSIARIDARVRIGNIQRGRELGKGVTAGFFAGSIPDLTSWDYAPNHRIAGSFVNFAGGIADDANVGGGGTMRVIRALEGL